MTLVDVARRSIAEISIGTRVRKDPGDLAALADSIGRLGMLHPIVIAPTGDLLAGWRRLEAAKLLGLEEVPVRIAMDVADLHDALAVESDENAMRKDFTPSEADAMRRAVEALERPKARERQGGPGRDRSGKLPERSAASREVAAKATGLSRRTLDKAAKVIDTANDETAPAPVREAAQAAVELMDRTGKVDPAYQAVREAEVIGEHVAEVMPELVENQAGREAQKAIRQIVSALKSVDPEVAGAGTRRAKSLDFHIDKADAALAWLTTYRKALVGLALVKEAQ